MSSEGSVTRCIGALIAGDAGAADQLWKRYFPRLVGLAHKKLENAPRGAADSEVVALSAMATFYRRAQQGEFPELTGRDCLWKLLVVITARKAAHVVRDERRRRPPGPAVLVSDDEVLNGLVSREDDPAFAAQVAEEYQRLLARLGEANLVKVAVARMEGYTEKEIAAPLGCAPRTVRRMLQLIRRIWANEGLP
jgi:DNA-directed RNA polymerase specialized sigma24 family protein